MVKPDSDLLIDAWKELQKKFDKSGAIYRDNYKYACDQCPHKNPTNLQLANVENARRRLQKWLDLRRVKTNEHDS